MLPAMSSRAASRVQGGAGTVAHGDVLQQAPRFGYRTFPQVLNPLSGIQHVPGLGRLADGGVVRRELLIRLQLVSSRVSGEAAQAAVGGQAGGSAPGRSGRPGTGDRATLPDRPY
jgi:hypothetical protein